MTDPAPCRCAGETVAIGPLRVFIDGTAGSRCAVPAIRNPAFGSTACRAFARKENIAKGKHSQMKSSVFARFPFAAAPASHRRHRPIRLLALACALSGGSLPLFAADVVVQPAAGSGFVVKDAIGANERLRVQETGAVSLPGVVAAAAQSQGLCMSATGQLGPCSGGTSGSYTAATGLSLTGTAFSVAPTFQLPQGCAPNQTARWNGTAWVCAAASGGGVLPAGTVNQTLRFDASNTLVTNDLLRAFGDGGLVVGGNYRSGAIPATGAGVRLMWYPAKAAFRAGYVGASQWDDVSVGVGSVAMGDSTVAAGAGSVAMGFGSIAADYATAMGETTQALGTGSVAIGTNTIASGIYSIALGVGAVADGGRSTAIGDEGTIARGGASVAMGDGTRAEGIASTAMGSRTTALKDFSVAMGVNAHAEGPASTAMGDQTKASGEASTAMGHAAEAAGYAAVSMGYYTQASGSFSVAMGSNVSTGSHKGSFIYGDSSARTNIVNDRDDQFLVFASGGINLYSGMDTMGNPIGAALASGTSSWTTISDRNAKTAVRPVDGRDVLEKVAALPLNTWQYKTQDAKYRHMGPMAQDFYSAFHLGESDKGIDTVDADGVALAAIQGLNALLREKDAKIAALDAELSTQKRELEAQKTQVAALSSLAGELADVKTQLAALRRSPPSAMTVALTQP